MIFAFESLQRDTDEILQAIVDQSQDCIKVLSATGELEYMNANGRAALAIKDFNAVSGLAWTELWPEESRDLVTSAVERASRGERSRFEAYCPTMAGEPRWWDVSVSPIIDSYGRLTHILATSRDVTLVNAERQSERDRRARAEAEVEAHDIVAREMRHRLKNIMAIVGSIARLTGSQQEKTGDFLALFDQRLNDLASAQYLLTEYSDLRANLGSLVRQVVGGPGGDARIIVSPLPDVRLGEQETRVVALVLGELLTNARKYGGLTGEGGSVVLNVTEERGTVRFRWQETCEEPVVAPEKTGSGMTLMRRISLGQPEPFEVEWGEEGIVAGFAVRA